MGKNILSGKISIIVTYTDKKPYGDDEFNQMLKSVIASSYKNFEIVLVDIRGENSKPDYLDERIRNHRKLIYVPINFVNQAKSLNAGIGASKGKFILIVSCESAPVFLYKGGLGAYVMAMNLNKKSGMIYSDYELVANGDIKEVHLLDYHQGRMMDNVDFGKAICYRKKALNKVGWFWEDYKSAEVYDMRLRMSEKFELTLISNRYSGSLYSVNATAKGQNVFDYLLAGKDVQLEMEDVCTKHLKNIGAYMAPGANHKEISYTPEEEKQFNDCIATVVVPVNNRPEFMPTAIESVQNQTLKKVEVIIVVNGGTKDSTVKAVKEYMKGGSKYDSGKPAVRLIVTDINNLGYCLNMGINAARGKFYVQLDSDDRLKPDAVEKIVNTFNSDSKAAMAIGSYEVWEKKADGQLVRMKEIPVVTHDEWTYENGRNNLLRINGAGAPRAGHIKIMKNLGWFGMNNSAHSRNYGEDYEFVLKASEQYNIARVWDPIYEVIRHSGGTDHNIDQGTVDRNNNAKDHMRLETIKRRIKINKKLSKKV